MADSEIQTDGSEEPQVFYNVMPEVSATGSIASSGVDVPARQARPMAPEAVVSGPTATNITITQPTKGGFFSIFKNKWFLMSVGFVLLVAIATAAVWYFMRKPHDVAQVTNTNTGPAQPTNPDVTTPGDWLARFFGSDTCTNLTQCGDKADPDRDGFTNKQEFDTGTDPNNPDSDSDGIADGDEKNVFDTDPLLSRTYREGDYSDADFVKGGYDIHTNAPYTDSRKDEIVNRIKDKGLHQPTLTTLGPAALTLYDFKDPNAKTLEDLGIDTSPQAKLDRDTRRQDAIKKVGAALLKYQKDKKTFPATSDFSSMVEAIKSYNTEKTDYNDPINKMQYVYSYSSGAKNSDFTLSYFSETQNQLIKYTTKDALSDSTKQDAAANNQQRQNDLQNIKMALIIYSSAQIDSNSTKVFAFPTAQQYPNVLVPRYLTKVPVDPNGSSYAYTVNDTFDSFTLKAVYDNPPKGVTGFMCNENECKDY